MGIDHFLLLWQFLGNLRNLRDSHAALAVGSSETKAGEPSSVTRIISECESALTFLNRDLGILSASISREKVRPDFSDAILDELRLIYMYIFEFSTCSLFYYPGTPEFSHQPPTKKKKNLTEKDREKSYKKEVNFAEEIQGKGAYMDCCRGLGEL
ncbi:hypothetical protein NC652_030709 [Populus alba x Populus x berolinensis]|nr:hypothetical protein NC652_030709 [Populus alba x Populus x berolinensis]